MNDLKKSDLKMSSLNVRTTYHIYYFTFKLFFLQFIFYDLNVYTINVIADDETKIGLYEIYFLNN
jgi:hypothetical protein